jgi:hypothetical protein
MKALASFSARFPTRSVACRRAIATLSRRAEGLVYQPSQDGAQPAEFLRRQPSDNRWRISFVTTIEFLTIRPKAGRRLTLPGRDQRARSDIRTLWVLSRPLGGDRIARVVRHALERWEGGWVLGSVATGILAKPPFKTSNTASPGATRAVRGRRGTRITPLICQSRTRPVIWRTRGQPPSLLRSLVRRHNSNEKASCERRPETLATQELGKSRDLSNEITAPLSLFGACPGEDGSCVEKSERPASGRTNLN